MRRIFVKLITLCALLFEGQTAVASAEVRKWIWSDTEAYGLARDLTVPFTAPEALMPLRVRPFEPADEEKLFGKESESPRGGGDANSYLLKNRRAFLRQGIPTCYVAVTEASEPCYMQWLIGPESNERLREYFSGIFPELRADERLLEYAFTSQAFQGKRVMAAAMARVAEQAVASGASRAITFVDTDNVPALKGCKRAGFEPYVKRITSWRFMRRSIRFEPLAEQSDLSGERHTQRSARQAAV